MNHRFVVSDEMVDQSNRLEVLMARASSAPRQAFHTRVLQLREPILMEIVERSLRAAYLFADSGTCYGASGNRAEFAKGFALKVLLDQAPAVVAGDPTDWSSLSRSALVRRAIDFQSAWRPGRTAIDDALRVASRSGVSRATLAILLHASQQEIKRSICRAGRRANSNRCRGLLCLLQGPLCSRCR